MPIGLPVPRCGYSRGGCDVGGWGPDGMCGEYCRRAAGHSSQCNCLQHAGPPASHTNADVAMTPNIPNEAPVQREPYFDNAIDPSLVTPDSPIGCGICGVRCWSGLLGSTLDTALVPCTSCNKQCGFGCQFGLYSGEHICKVCTLAELEELRSFHADWDLSRPELLANARACVGSPHSPPGCPFSLPQPHPLSPLHSSPLLASILLLFLYGTRLFMTNARPAQAEGKMFQRWKTAIGPRVGKRVNISVVDAAALNFADCHGTIVAFLATGAGSPTMTLTFLTAQRMRPNSHAPFGRPGLSPLHTTPSPPPGCPLSSLAQAAAIFCSAAEPPLPAPSCLETHLLPLPWMKACNQLLNLSQSVKLAASLLIPLHPKTPVLLQSLPMTVPVPLLPEKQDLIGKQPGTHSHGLSRPAQVAEDAAAPLTLLLGVAGTPAAATVLVARGPAGVAVEIAAVDRVVLALALAICPHACAETINGTQVPLIDFLPPAHTPGLDSSRAPPPTEAKAMLPLEVPRPPPAESNLPPESKLAIPHSNSRL